jgi:hypothetical protein
MGAKKSETKKGPKSIAAPQSDGKKAAAQKVALVVPVVAAARILPQITSPMHGDVLTGKVFFTLTTNLILQNYFLVILDEKGNIFDPPGMIPVDFSGGSPVVVTVDFTNIPPGTAYTFRLVGEAPSGRTSHEIDVTVGP